MTNSEQKWKTFEKLVHSIQSDLSDTAEVRHNVYLDGVDSGRKRQIDILVKQKIGQYDLKIIMECKDTTDKVGLPEIDAFIGKTQDVRAQKGAIVSAAGFSAGAIKHATANQIDTFTVLDAEEHDWKKYFGIPTLATFGKVGKVQFELGGNNEIKKISISDPITTEIFDHKGNSFGTISKFFQRQWNHGLIAHDFGFHEKVLLTPIAPAIVVDGENHYEVFIYVSYEVNEEVYFGELPVLNARGFWNEQEQKPVFPTNADFITDWISPEQIENDWAKYDSRTEIIDQAWVLLEGYSYFPID